MAGRTPSSRDGPMCSETNVRTWRISAGKPRVRALAARYRGHWLKKCCGQRVDRQKRWDSGHNVLDGWKNGRTGVSLDVGCMLSKSPKTISGRCKTTWLCKSNSGRSICGRRSKNVQQFQKLNVLMYGYVSHNTNGRNHGQKWRSRDTSWTKLWRSSIIKIDMWKTSGRSFIWTSVGQNTVLGMSFCSLETKIILVGIRGWHENVWKHAEYGSHMEVMIEKKRYWRTHVISWSCMLGMYSAWMQTEWNNCRTIYEDVWITYFCWSNRKITVWEKPHAQTVAWSYDMEGHAQKCVDRSCELANKEVE